MNIPNSILTDNLELIKYLFSIKDYEYKKFNERIIKTNNIIGVRIPVLKKIAKEIAKKDYLTFIKNNKHKYYEEIMLHGLVITYLKDTKAKTYVITNDKEIADISDMAIMIDEKESIYAFYQAAIVL